MTIKHYFDEPLIFEFTANVIDATHNADNTSNVILNETYFYPTGGGQSQDIGTLNGQAVIDVRKEGETVIHVVEGNALTGQVIGLIDATNRRRNMSAHTGQHILSAVALRDLQAETVAVRINAFGLSTVDLAIADLTQEKIDSLETSVNEEIRANHPVYSRFVSPDSPELNQLRRAVKFDKVAGDVRLVEIETVDLSACAGTHVPFTGMLGMLKILKVENYKGGSRIHFAVGDEALTQFRIYHQTLETVSNVLSSGVEQVPELVSKLQSERSDLAKQVAIQSEQLVTYEAQTILADVHSPFILTFQNRDTNALRKLANLLVEPDGNYAVLMNQQGTDVMLMIASSTMDGIHAGDTLKSILAEFDGRGGGRETFAQGVLKNFEDLYVLKIVIEKHLLT